MWHLEMTRQRYKLVFQGGMCNEVNLPVFRV